MVAGFNQTAQIETDQQASGRSCATAGTCSAMPTCPWDRFINPGGTGYVKAGSGEIGTCLSPQVMAAQCLSPFSGIDANQVGCGCPTAVSCGDGSGSGFCCSPFATSSGKKGCIQDFSSTGGCHPNDCASISNYDPQQICDPYGQCDSALNRTAKYPSVTVSGNSVTITDYIENIRSACSQNSGIYTWAFDDLATVPGCRAATSPAPTQTAPSTTR